MNNKYETQIKIQKYGKLYDEIGRKMPFIDLYTAISKDEPKLGILPSWEIFKSIVATYCNLCGINYPRTGEGRQVFLIDVAANIDCDTDKLIIYRALRARNAIAHSLDNGVKPVWKDSESLLDSAVRLLSISKQIKSPSE